MIPGAMAVVVVTLLAIVAIAAADSSQDNNAVPMTHLGYKLNEPKSKDHKEKPVTSEDFFKRLILKGRMPIDEQEFAEWKYGRSTIVERDYSRLKVGPGTVIAGITLTVNILNKILDTLSNINRAVAIGVDNETGAKWTNTGVFFRAGTSDTAIPYQVNSGQALLWDARKTDGPVATGAVGVFTYAFNGNTIACMYSVPYDYNFYSNWWNVKIYSGNVAANQATYEDLYYDTNPFVGDGQWKTRSLGYGLRVRGNMGSSGKAPLEIHIEKQ